MSQIQRRLHQLRALRGVAPAERLPAIKSKVGAISRRTRRRAKTAPVRLVELAFGPRPANLLFWCTPGVERNWFDVAQRLGNLQKRHPDAVAHFVTTTLRRTPSAVVVTGLAQRPQTSGQVRAWLTAQLDGADRSLTRRIARSPMLGGAILGSAALLLDADQADRIENLVVETTDSLNPRIFDFAASMGYRPHQVAGGRFGTKGAAGSRHAHRAVIAKELGDPDAYAVHFHGADRVTVLATVETFGRFDVTPYLDWPGVGDVQVEHIRTRTPRFSQPYIDLHTATARIADVLVGNLGPFGELLDSSDLPVLAVEVADWLFFRAMRLNAVERLLDDPTIDHVVVALGSGNSTADFVNVLSGSVRLRDDPRVEFASASPSEADRGRFLATVDSLRHPAQLRRPPQRSAPPSVLRDARRRIDALGTGLALPQPSTRPQLLFVTANNSAYNDSTAAYIAAVADDYEVRCLHAGKNASALALSLRQRSPSAAAMPIEFLVQPTSAAAPALADALHAQLFPLIGDLAAGVRPDTRLTADHMAGWAARSGLGRMCHDLLAPSILRLAAADRWFAEMAARGVLPDAVVITPQRAPATHAFAPLARRYGVPSITLEPHAQDANYSRYIKISSDYYGVMSDYFRESTATGFDMPIERIRTLGSPRQIRPADYDGDAEQDRARHAFTEAGGGAWPSGSVTMAFFCQPSSWEHVEKIWNSVLDAAARTGTRVLLKPHPEESVSRVRQYLDAVRAMGLDDQVIHLTSADAATTVALADIVATGYSAAALDAAVRGKPVVCITDGDLRYPVDIPAIVDAPLVRSADELAALLKEFAADPAPFQDRARRLVEREPQFVTGPGERLRDLVAVVIERGKAGLRTDGELPARLFLDPPHPVFPV